MNLYNQIIMLLSCTSGVLSPSASSSFLLAPCLASSPPRVELQLREKHAPHENIAVLHMACIMTKLSLRIAMQQRRATMLQREGEGEREGGRERAV